MSDLNAIHFKDCIKNCFIACIAVCIFERPLLYHYRRCYGCQTTTLWPYVGRKTITFINVMLAFSRFSRILQVI